MSLLHSISLQMFLDQHKKGSGGSFLTSNATFAPLAVPFKDWVVGYYIKSPSGDEEFKITAIKSADSKPRREDCELDLLNSTTQETRTIKGSTASRYTFSSHGDVPPPVPEKPVVVMREDCIPLVVNIGNIREFYPRKHGYEGTRILMSDKTAYIVADTFTDVCNLVKKAGGFIAGGPYGTDVMGGQNKE